MALRVMVKKIISAVVEKGTNTKITIGIKNSSSDSLPGWRCTCIGEINSVYVIYPIGKINQAWSRVD
jgi:hypothetical protein